MPRPPQKTRLHVEPLEGRSLLSGLPHPSGAVEVLAAKLRTVHLLGAIKGTYAATILNGIPSNLTITGKGNVSPIGGAALVASFSSINQALTSGQANVVLGTQRGMVILSITSSAPPSSFTKPFKVSFAIVRASGAYANFTGHGAVTVTIMPNLSSLGANGKISLKFQLR
jgi:hypothetical protein